MAGNPPECKKPGLLTRAYEILDEAQVPAVQAVVKLLESKSEMTRLRAAVIILAKRIPDLTHDVGAHPPTAIYVIHADEHPSLKVENSVNRIASLVSNFG